MTVKVDKLIRTFIKIRDTISAKDRDHKKWKEGLTEQLTKIELAIMAKCNEQGVDSLKADGNTAFKKSKDSVTIADKEGFKKFLATTILMRLQPHNYKTSDDEWQPDGEVDLNEHVERVLDSSAFELLTLSANKSNCKEYMEENLGLMPDGIAYTKETVIQIRKGK